MSDGQTYDYVIGGAGGAGAVLQGLRIADISVLPAQVSGNTAAPAMAIGWIAADLIRGS